MSKDKYRTDIKAYGINFCKHKKHEIVVLPLFFEILWIILITLVIWAPFGENGLIFFIIFWLIWEICVFCTCKYYNKNRDAYIFKRRILLIIISILTWVFARHILGYDRKMFYAI